MERKLGRRITRKRLIIGAIALALGLPMFGWVYHRYLKRDIYADPRLEDVDQLVRQFYIRWPPQSLLNEFTRRIGLWSAIFDLYNGGRPSWDNEKEHTAIRKLGPKAIIPLIHAYADFERTPRCHFEYFIGYHILSSGPGSPPVRLTDPCLDQFLSILRKDVVPTVKELDALRDLLTHADPLVQRIAVQQIGEIGPKAKRALPQLRKFTVSTDVLLKQAATDAIGKIR